ncbi:MAG: hypothetical protein JNK74_14835 [Candidatus Hydrogenedentes bacterium]|nr:hypothetical protein [Candidatus Hydrogenedentota bacterium]
MADDKRNEDNLDTPGDSGLGNLPPLSDFDSGGMDSDGGLPPLGNFDSGGSPTDSAGLPPISDIQVETPQPTGGNVRRPPFGFDSAINDTFSSGTPGIDTPAGTKSSQGLSPIGSGFQDLAADSDFSPETPEIGPGPDSNMDTPMFDSAFGGGSGSGFGGGRSTGAPTQAMETPMFGQPVGGRDNRGFDAGAFGGGGGDFGMGTPAPDFSPDTDMRAPRGMGGGISMGASEPAGGGRKGGAGALVAAAAVALIVGIVAGPFVAEKVAVLPNPLKPQLEAAQQLASTEKARADRLDAELKKAVPVGGVGTEGMTPAQLEQMRTDAIAAQEKLTEVQTALKAEEDKLAAASADLLAKNEEVAKRDEEYQNLSNQLSITEARQRGLVSEVDRLTNHVGKLEEAAQRSDQSKDALAHAVDRLYIKVKEGLPLTPTKFDRSARLAEVEKLRTQISESKWVTPSIQDAYTGLYLKELEIAQAQEYFYSKIPVVDAYGSRVHKWAECVMRGNHEVVYRTFDGQNIGVFTNLGTGESPAWGFKEEFTPAAKKELEEQVITSRIPGFEEKIQALAERELSMDGDTAFQKVFSSL